LGKHDERSRDLSEYYKESLGVEISKREFIERKALELHSRDQALQTRIEEIKGQLKGVA